MKLCNLIGVSIAIIGLAASTQSNASIIYQTGVSNPWGSTGNDVAMDAAFGAGNWTKSNGFNLGQFTGASFVFLDGSDSNANQLNIFLSNNIAAIESFVNGGGRLFINSAPNEGTSYNLGFGVTLNYGPDLSPNAVVTAAGVAAGLTAGGITTTYTGNFFGHALVSGGGISDLIHGDNGILFGAMQYGSGFAAFGGQTSADFFHQPQPDAMTLLTNELLYVANAQTSQVPEPATALLVSLGLFGIAARHREQKGKPGSDLGIADIG